MTKSWKDLDDPTFVAASDAIRGIVREEQDRARSGTPPGRAPNLPWKTRLQQSALPDWTLPEISTLLNTMRGALTEMGERGSSDGRSPAAPALLARLRATQPKPAPAAWLVIAAGEDRQHAGNAGYDDLPEEHYSWDQTVANHARINAGDVIVLWDKTTLIGASRVDQIEIAEGVEKERYRCPACGKTSMKERANLAPKYRCYKCRTETDAPVVEKIEVTTYRSKHHRLWVDLGSALPAVAIRECCESPKSQHSLRPLDINALRQRLVQATGLDSLRLLLGGGRGGGSKSGGWRTGPGGHTTRTVRARVGQRGFRQNLLANFGPVCAFTGRQPGPALEAAHLYSYAAVGEHHEHGGLLLRRDIHRLFDLGFLTVDIDSMKVEVDAELADFGSYQALAGAGLEVPITAASRAWLAAHREQHRG